MVLKNMALMQISTPEPHTGLCKICQSVRRLLMFLTILHLLTVSSVTLAAEAHQFVKLGQYAAGSRANAAQLNTIMEAFRKEAMADSSGTMLDGVVDAGWCYCRASALAHVIEKSGLPDVELLGYATFGSTRALPNPGAARYPFIWHVAPVLRIKSNKRFVWVADPSIGYATIPDWVDYFNGRVNRDSVELSIIPLDQPVRLGPTAQVAETSTTTMYRRFRDTPSHEIPNLHSEHVASDFEMVMRVKMRVESGQNARNEQLLSEEEAQYLLEEVFPRMNLMKNEGAFVPEIAVCATTCGTCIVM